MAVAGMVKGDIRKMLVELHGEGGLLRFQHSESAILLRPPSPEFSGHSRPARIQVVTEGAFLETSPPQAGSPTISYCF